MCLRLFTPRLLCLCFFTPHNHHSTSSQPQTNSLHQERRAARESRSRPWLGNSSARQGAKVVVPEVKAAATALANGVGRDAGVETPASDVVVVPSALAVNADEKQVVVVAAAAELSQLRLGETVVVDMPRTGRGMSVRQEVVRGWRCGFGWTADVVRKEWHRPGAENSRLPVVRKLVRAGMFLEIFMAYSPSAIASFCHFKVMSLFRNPGVLPVSDCTFLSFQSHVAV